MATLDNTVLPVDGGDNDAWGVKLLAWAGLVKSLADGHDAQIAANTAALTPLAGLPATVTSLSSTVGGNTTLLGNVQAVSDATFREALMDFLGSIFTGTAVAYNDGADGFVFTAGTGGGGGDASTNTATSVDGEAVLFNGTTGKSLKRSTLTGIVKQTSGVTSVATPGTDYQAPAGPFAPSGFTGATAASRYVGATASGAPTSGTFAVGDYTVAQDGAIYVCNSAGSPGGWLRLPPLTASTTPSALGTAAVGTSTSAARADHVHSNTGVALSGVFTATSTGATSATRFVGGTAAVAPPTTGTFAVGDLVTGQGGALFVCTGAGTPGTWVTIVPVGSATPAALGTAAAGTASTAARADHVHSNTGLALSGVFTPTSTGATAAMRLAGGTASGPPTSGTFAVGDTVGAQDGFTWTCTAAGSPGTWICDAMIVEKVNTVATGGAAQTIPAVTVATMNRVTLTANITWTFPAATAGTSFVLDVTQNGTGGWAHTWPAAVKWSGGAAPALSTAAGKRDVLTFTCIDGSTWVGTALTDVR